MIFTDPMALIQAGFDILVAYGLFNIIWAFAIVGIAFTALAMGKRAIQNHRATQYMDESDYLYYHDDEYAAERDAWQEENRLSPEEEEQKRQEAIEYFEGIANGEIVPEPYQPPTGLLDGFEFPND